MPVVNSVRDAGDNFMATRSFVTVNKDKQLAEVGELTVSTEPLNKDSYQVMKVDEIEVHYQNYDFGNVYMSDLEIKNAHESGNADNLRKAKFLFKFQEPLRTVAWMGKQKKLSKIFLTSSLERVSGGSTGFTLEALWYGYIDEYVYTGSSSPFTGWQPSYPLG